MAVITISRQYGTNAKDFARELSKALGYSYIDKDIYKRVAERNNISIEEIKSIESITGLGIDIIQNLIDNDFIKRIVGKNNITFENEEIVKFIENSIKEFASNDNIILLGRAAQCILQNDENVFHIKLIKNFNDRVNFLIKKGITENGAKSTINRKDEERKNFIKKFYRQDWDNPELYHLILNMSKISVDKGITLIKDLITQSSV